MAGNARPITIRLAVALTGVMGLLVLVEQSPALQQLFEPINVALSRVTELALQHLKIPVARQDAVLTHPDGFGYRITYVCSGFRPTALIAVTLFAVPATWVSRLCGLFLAIAGMQALNLCRLVHLYWTGVDDPDAFFVTHRVTWNIIAVIAVAGFLALWLYLNRRSTPVERRRSQTSHAFS